jgi:hypothetical protein
MCILHLPAFYVPSMLTETILTTQWILEQCKNIVTSVKPAHWSVFSRQLLGHDAAESESLSADAVSYAETNMFLYSV